MEEWFTVEEIDGDTFAISEYRHWEETHCYLLLGKRRAALIDTGLGVSDIKAVVGTLTCLPVTVLTTHVHWDHIGGHRDFETIAAHELERDWLEGHFPLSLQAVKGNLTAKPCCFPEGFDPARYEVFQGKAQAAFRDGDCFDLGGRTLTAVHTPGHSPGHCCFYEQKRRYLYSGDLIYQGCLDAFYPTTDPLLFAQSVEKVGRLPVEQVLPGHHELHIPAGLIGEVGQGFRSLAHKGKLKQGSGVFDFGTFQIHI